jgi:CRISPR-associated protein Cas2
VFVLVCYDIGDVEGLGGVRLRRVAEACLNHGTRVQYSVFECRISEPQWVKLRQRLLNVIDFDKDSLRFYKLCEDCQDKVEYHGLKKGLDPTGLLVL